MHTRFQNKIKELQFSNATLQLNQCIDSMPNLFGKKSDVRYHIEIIGENGLCEAGEFNFTSKTKALKRFNEIVRNRSL